MSTGCMTKAYVVVRSDLSRGQQIVQSAHVVAEHENQYPGSMSGKTMIVLSVPNAIILDMLYEYLQNRNVKCTMFWEPDVMADTALAISPGDYPVLRGFSLAGKS